MPASHLYFDHVVLGVDDWRRIIAMSWWDGSSWRSISNWNMHDGTVYRLSFTTSPGPVATLEVLPASNTMSRHTTQDYICNGYDADGVGVFVDPSLVSWAVSRFGDSIDAFGTLTAGGTNGTGTVTATYGALTGLTPYTVTF